VRKEGLAQTVGMAHPIGFERRAAEIAEYHLNGVWMPADMGLIGTGSQRTVYVDYLTDTVYKVGDDGANRQEVRTFAELRADGVDYAPDATLWTVQVPTEGDGDQIVTVVCGRSRN
jgi:hypothetical protein